MDELIKAIFTAPFQVLLFISGMLLLVLAIVGNFKDIIKIDKVGRFLSASIGTLLLILSLSQNALPEGSATQEPEPVERKEPLSSSQSIPTFSSSQKVYEKIEEGRAQLTSEKFELARSVFREAQYLDDQHPLPYFYIGLTYDREGEIDEADRFYQSAEERYLALAKQERTEQLQIRDYDALVEMCHVVNKDRKYESSLNLSSMALDIPSVPKGKRYAAYACKGTSLFWLDRSESDRKESEHAFNEALLIKDSHLIHYNLGSLYASRFRDYLNAENAYKASLSLSNEFIPALRDLGFTYILSRNPEDARNIFKEISKNHSVEKEAREGLRLADTLEVFPQVPLGQLLSSISSLNAFGNFTVHDFEQDLILKDPHDHDHGHEHDHDH
ncbi:MAG: hypothetical protein AAGD25_36625 [Cyanobacteria bacterium P01_F01_bin.150]